MKYYAFKQSPSFWNTKKKEFELEEICKKIPINFSSSVIMQ